MKNGVKSFKKNSSTCHLLKKTPLDSLDNTFLHKLCGFEGNRSSSTQEILTTAGGLAENGLPAKTT